MPAALRDAEPHVKIAEVRNWSASAAETVCPTPVAIQPSWCDKSRRWYLWIDRPGDIERQAGKFPVRKPGLRFPSSACGTWRAVVYTRPRFSTFSDDPSR